MDELIKRMHEQHPDLIGPDGEVLRLPDLGSIFNEKGHDGPCGPKLSPPSQTVKPEPDDEIDGQDPTDLDHLCIWDLNRHPGPVEDCCGPQWRDEGVEP